MLSIQAHAMTEKCIACVFLFNGAFCNKGDLFVKIVKMLYISYRAIAFMCKMCKNKGESKPTNSKIHIFSIYARKKRLLKAFFGCFCLTVQMFE